MKGLILAGGMGTRFRPLSHTGPKQLLPIANKPVLHYIVEDLVNAGITEIGIVVGYTPERIKHITDSLGNGSEFKASITYIEQEAPLGLAHAVATAKKYLGKDDFVMYLGDNMLGEGIGEYVESFKERSPDAAITVFEVENPQIYGTAIMNAHNQLMEVEEKPKNPRSNYAIAGIYFFKSSIFDAIKKIKPGKNGELQITDAIQELIKEKKKVEAYILKSWWDDTGTPSAVLNANRLVLLDLKEENKGTIEKGATVKQPVSIGKGTIVKKGSVIMGPVVIGNNCEIGPHVYIGPYTSIGSNSKIIRGEINNSVFFDSVHIDFDDKIVNSILGKHVKVIAERKRPLGHKLIMGENSEIVL